MFLSTDPIGTKDDPNLYLYAVLDPVNLTDPTGTATCGRSVNSEHCKSLMALQREALADVRRSRADLSNLANESRKIFWGRRSELSERAQATADRLQDYFGSSNLATVNRVSRELGAIERRLSDMSGRYRYETPTAAQMFQNHMSASNPAYSGGGERIVWINPSYFGQGHRRQVGGLPHEWGREAWLNFAIPPIREVYGDRRVIELANSGFLGRYMARNNAENYALFAVD